MAQPVFRPGKTKQDKQPVEQRQRVKDAEARRKLPSDKRKSIGTIVRWSEAGTRHLGKVTQDDGDTVTVEYGSGNKLGRRTLDRDEVTVRA